MSSKKRRNANRRNAQKSTGPKTKAGKAKSSMNAFKHGLTGGFCLMPHENAEAFWEHVNKLMIENRPQGYEEHMLIILMAECYWRLHRAHDLDGISNEQSDCREDLEKEQARINIYINRIDRQIVSHKAKLRELRALRKAGEHHPIPNAQLFPQNPAENGAPSYPVALPLTRAEGERYRWRREDLTQGITRPTEGGLYKFKPNADAAPDMGSFLQDPLQAGQNPGDHGSDRGSNGSANGENDTDSGTATA